MLLSIEVPAPSLGDAQLARRVILTMEEQARAEQSRRSSLFPHSSNAQIIRFTCPWVLTGVEQLSLWGRVNLSVLSHGSCLSM